MAFASRLLSRSKQLYAGQVILQQNYAVPVRFYAKDPAPKALKGDEMLKNIFPEVKNKFETAIGVLRKEKITIDLDDPAVVSQYTKVMKTVREKAGLFSESERIKYTIETRTKEILDMRTYLLTVKEIREKRGIIDELGAEAMMFDALEKVEKELQKPLMRNDKKAMALLTAEYEKINKKLGIRKEDLPKYEEELELKIAKAQLEEIKKDVVEAMETQKKKSAEAIAMPSQATTSFSGNMKRALAGLRRINLEGLRWRVFDAKGQVLGRLASQIATVVQGKDKPTYAPNRDDGDMCIVLNAKDVCVTGRKMTDKFYRWHTGYVGHLKERSLKDQMAKDPTEVIRKAVLRMLPRNKLRDDRDRKLRIFANGEHPFGDRPLESYVMPPRRVREMRPRARRAMIRAQKKAEQQQQGTTDMRNSKRKREAEAEVTQ